MTLEPAHSLPPAGAPRRRFLQDFRLFFQRGLAALLPTLITLVAPPVVIDVLVPACVLRTL